MTHFKLFVPPPHLSIHVSTQHLHVNYQFSTILMVWKPIFFLLFYFSFIFPLFFYHKPSSISFFFYSSIISCPFRFCPFSPSLFFLFLSAVRSHHHSQYAAILTQHILTLTATSSLFQCSDHAVYYKPSNYGSDSVPPLFKISHAKT